MSGESRLGLFIAGGLLVVNGMQRMEHAATVNTRTDVVSRLVVARRRWYRRVAGAATVLELAAGAALLVYVRARDAGPRDEPAAEGAPRTVGRSPLHVLLPVPTRLGRELRARRDDRAQLATDDAGTVTNPADVTEGTLTRR